MARPKPKSALSASDDRIVKTLRDQIQSNQVAFDPKHRYPDEPSAFRLDHPRATTADHPIYLLRPKIKGVDSVLLAPASQLYMHFFSHALPIFHTLIHCPPTLLPRKASAPMVWEYPEPLALLTKEQRAHTWEFLGGLAEKIKWDPSHDKSPGWKPQTQGMCTLRSKFPIDEGMLGFGSTITTSRDLVKALEDAVKAVDELDQQWCSFSLGVVWLHELSHAVEHAVLPGGEVFLGAKARTSELGFEVETRLFGGHLVFATTEGWRSDRGQTGVRCTHIGRRGSTWRPEALQYR